MEAYRLMQAEMAEVERFMRQEMQSEVPLAELVMQYSLGQGGKRFRPLLALLSSALCGGVNEKSIIVAAFIEFIHSATLLHDDVVDESPQRRGQAAAQCVFGNAASVLVGDFLYTRAFQLMVRVNHMPVIATMAEAVNQIAAGEVMQLSHIGNADLDESAYYRVIELKTAVLFAAACRVAAQCQNASPEAEEALHRYGKCLGMAFQIIDDLLDYAGDTAEMGKAVGDDLSEGKNTLILIRCLNQLPPPERERLRTIIQNGDREALPEVLDFIQQTDALAYSRHAAQKLIDEALQGLAIFPDSAAKAALFEIAEACLKRKK